MFTANLTDPKFETRKLDLSIDKDQLAKSCEYWKDKEIAVNSSIESLRVDKNLLSMITYYDGKLYAYSGADNISKWISNTIRIHNKTASTRAYKYKAKSFLPEYFSFFPVAHGSVQIAILKKKYPDYNFVCTTNITNDPYGKLDKVVMRYIHNSKIYSLEGEKIIWYIKQRIIKINPDLMIEQGRKYYKDKWESMINI